MIVNNKSLIKPLLIFPKKDDSFYFVQVLQRKKDNPELGNNSRVIKTYFIKSVEHLNFHWEEMIKLADLFNARVSINLNPRSFEKAGFQVMSKIAHMMENKDYNHIYKAYESICGNYHSEMDKRWLIDIDKEDIPRYAEIKSFVEEIQSEITNKPYKVLAELLSRSGIHLITNPFNLEKFTQKFPKIDVHKNNPVVLYYKEKEI